jgi:3',5'-cyclic AMP phosphodiesterase CpdA
MPLRFLHTSDIHLLDLSGVRPWHYLNKRLTGGINLAIGRARAHDVRLFDEMMGLVERLEVERVVITGDLTNLSFDSEFAFVRDRLDALSVPATVIPGNHDAYTRGCVRHGRFEAHFAHLMEGERVDGQTYPFMQRVDDVALIGLSTAVATLPLHATGELGAEQIARTRTLLRRAAAEKLCRIVLIHHPPIVGASKARHDLLDLEAFGGLIAEEGADLILHGHEHVRMSGVLPGPKDADVPVHGIGSGTSVSIRPGRQAAFSVYHASRDAIRRDLYAWNGTAFERLDP